MYFFGGDTAAYLLLTAFDLSLGLIVIVGLTPDLKPVAALPARFHWIVGVPILAPFLAITAAIITAPVAMPVIILGLAAGVDWTAILSRGGFWTSVGTMATLAATHALSVQAQRSSREAAASASDAAKERAGARGAYAAQVTLIATFVALAYVLIHFGRSLFYAIPPAYVGLLVFYDLRPDLARRILPDLWQPKT